MSLHLLYFIEKKERNLFVTTNNLHNSIFGSFNLFMFTEGDGTTINHMLKVTQFCNF